MDLRQLAYFVAVAEERSFSRGARREHVVQSAVSAAVNRLEQELEVALFDRTTRSITLTAAGAALLPEAKATLRAAGRARESVMMASGELGGRVDIGSLQSSGPLDLPAVLAHVHAAHPQIRVRLHQASTGTAGHLAAVASGDLDLALVSTGTASTAVTLRTLAMEPLLFVCHPEHPFAARKKVELGAIAAETFVNFAAGWGVRAATDRAFELAGLRRNAPFEVSDYPTAAGLVRHRMACALMPASAAHQHLEALQHRDLRAIPLVQLITWTLSLATRAHSPLSPAAAAVADAFVEHANALPKNTRWRGAPKRMKTTNRA